MFPDLSVHTETVLTYEGGKVLLKLELKKGFGDVGIIITRERSTYLDVLNLALYRFSSFFSSSTASGKHRWEEEHLTSYSSGLNTSQKDKVFHQASLDYRSLLPSAAESMKAPLDMANSEVSREAFRASLQGFSAEAQNRVGDVPHTLAGLQCDRCQKTFTRAWTLSRHQASCKSVCLIPCDFCDQSFSRVDNLKVHVQRVHGIGPSLRCPSCALRFRSKVSFDKHLVSCRSDGV